MTSILAKEVKNVERDNSKLNEIRKSLENCYDLSFSKDAEEILEAIIQKLSVVVEALRKAEVYIKEAVTHIESTKPIIDSNVESDDKNRLLSEQVEKTHENLQGYWQSKASGFELLKDIVDNFWAYLPCKLKDVFEEWAKELAIQAAEEESEEKINLVVQETLKRLPSKITLTTEEVLAKVKQAIQERREGRLVKAERNFVASVFRAETEVEKNNLGDCLSSFEEREGEILGSVRLKSGETVELKLKELEAFWEKNSDEIAVQEYIDLKPRRTITS